MIDDPQPLLVTHRSKWTHAGVRLVLSWPILAFLVSATPTILAQNLNLEREVRNANSSSQRVQQEQWLLRGRAHPDKSPAAAALRYRAYLQKMRQRAKRRVGRRQLGQTVSCQNSPVGIWCPLGPAPLASDASGAGQEDYNWVSGRATAVIADPNDLTGNTVYLGGAYGGVWKSSNAGPLSPNPDNVIWDAGTLQSLTDNQATLAVGAIAIQPQLVNPNPANSVVVVGTGEANSSADSYYGLGILLSANAGQTWTLIPTDSTGTRSFAGMAFSSIAFNSVTTDLAVAATAGSSMGILEGLEDPVTANLGIYYSTDSGQQWTYANMQDGSVTTSPSSVTSVVYNAGAAEFYAAVRYHGFYSSSDGINWSRLPDQPGAGLTEANCPAQTVLPSSCPIYRGAIAAVPNRNEMYVWYVDANDNDQGIWVSTDAGNTWTQLDEAGITDCGDLFGCATEQGSYNLTLAAVPDNTATDLYAGAVNLYKCTITSIVPICNGTGSNTFLNLTHVYGCPPDFGSIAHVHPAQHAMSYMLIQNNTQDVMFFANDGGIYRALNAYTDLTTGSCGGSNQFDSLNQTLGSMTQLVSFSQSSTDPDIILGGSQGNGAAATDLALIENPWQSVNFGDNGYTAINPGNEDLWFVSTPADDISGVNIFSCPSGINCRTPDFANSQVVSSATLGGDTGAFYSPYILDPNNSGELIVGTCRIWRGPSNGGTYTVLSHSFETGGDGICTSDEINLVSSLAAGGPVDNNGFSNVMYAGTDGDGPLIPTSPTGGHVWVSTNVDGGLSTWVDQTGSINPNSYPVSGIALDPSDATGMTAYVTIMGFGTADFPTSQVWQTTNGGASWNDYTANLPDAPVNAVLVDTSTGTVYVATDVGVFSSSTASPNWTEVGQAGGYLPNVAVTALGMFENQAGTIKLLRASTYGRGVWQLPLITTPDFALSVPTNDLTVFAAQQGMFQGSAISIFGYSSTVNLSCTAGTTSPPPTCSISPSSLVPSASGTPFSVTAEGPIGDYNFNLHGVGTDQSQTTHNSALTLHVVNFGLTEPSPRSVTASVPDSSPPVHFQVTAAGSFNSAVNLSCAGLPDGSACHFEPSDSVNPTSQHPVSITLTIKTSTSTPTGTFPVTITGSVAGGPERTQNLSLTVTNPTNYSLVINRPTSLSTSVTGLAVFKGTLTSSDGYDSSVTLSCSGGTTAPPPSCVPNPAELTPQATGSPFTVTVKSSVVQAYNFDITAVGSDASHTTHTFPVTFTTTFDFLLTNDSSPQSVAAGQTALYDLNIQPLGSNFTDPVTFSCSGLPQQSTCSFNPARIAAGKGATSVTLTITSAAPVLGSVTPNRSPLLYALWLVLPGLMLLAPRGTLSRIRRGRAPVLLLLVAIAFTMQMVACGGGASSTVGNGDPGTNPGTYTVTVTAVSGSLSRSTPVTLTVN